MAKTKTVQTQSLDNKQSEIAVNFGNVEALKLRLLNEINVKLGQILEKLNGRSK
jgi:hypothetical protein